MRILCAPDSFKETLDAAAAAHCVSLSDRYGENRARRETAALLREVAGEVLRRYRR